MKLTRTIAFRLFLLIASLQTVILFVLAYATISIQQSTLMEQLQASAVRVSDIIARSTRHSMMQNHKEDVHEIIASIGREPGIDGIRIYNKQGEVVFATVAQDVGKRVDPNAEACVICHAGEKLETPATREVLRIFSTPDAGRDLGLIRPIRNEEECSSADCHAHPASKTILGVLDVKMSLAAVDASIASSRNRLMLLSALSVFLVGAISGAFIWLFVRRPVKKLIAGMEMVSSGRLDQRLSVATNDELGQMANTFNDMTEDLARARREITAWSHTLEQKVKEKTADLEKAHKQILRVEKMASLGHLASSVAHELNNPLEGILTFAKLLAKKIQKSALPPAEIHTYAEELKLIADEAQRSGNIVKNLLVFSHQGSITFRQIHFRTILERCTLLVNHHANMNGVLIRTSCTDDDLLECDGGQIQQLMVALMMNAVEAMAPVPGRAEGGVLAIEVRWSERRDSLVVRVSDTGQGMSEEVKTHIFEPFFTTKSEGKGVGLGLAIAYGIIERHHGMLEVESIPGQGTVFTVTLPTKQPDAAPVQDSFAAPPEGAHS
jgi:two-component system NtrC family sensor kinase